MNKPLVQLMTRKACCLCEDAEQVLQQLEAEGLCQVAYCDVDAQVALAARYGMDVPVLLLDGQPQLKHHIDADAVRELLSRMSSDL